MDFKLIGTDSQSSAKAGIITTDHGTIETPIFMPVGTVGSVKGVSHRELENDIDAKIILGNTYHLYLRPGLNVISEAGGLHKFTSWNRPILTDSGGYQVFSLAANRKLTSQGASFRSHIDGSAHQFTPESVMDIQRIIGADIMMAFDECPPGDADFNYAKKSLDLTEQWLGRCVNRFDSTEPLYGHSQTLFPIVQGCVYPDLRKRAAENVLQYNRDGYAIGGLSVGEPADVMYKMIELVNGILPTDKPRYLMGVGTPENILEAIALGVDMFDCVMPTRNGRNGMIFTSEGIINLRNQKWKNDFSPIDPNGPTFVDSRYTKAYLRHLFIAQEMLGAQIASIHNLGFYLWLVRESRKHILEGNFGSWKNQMVKKVSKRL
ncbi:MAG: tRNA guanosine(34) transglycosylase Tgt [Bacteroidales bacterium]|nr:tRNA guanosine(34) transglycosylase Tgt [Bacteroidales bacterium]HPD94658.1 tRNA guanosine(34) transglycosylase Tgt [Tenuifilaceae bacterium]HRX31063.1 tRNA guanosine(34) transglycosylase Tgt [Tenuifilaceae bacterium]